MAATTTWGFVGVAGTTTSFPIEGTNVYGVDISGVLTPKSIKLIPGVHILLTATTTDAVLVAALLDFIKRYGAGRSDAGGFPTQATVQNAYTLLTTT